jgi:threonine/homoserine/homoserine lactone efflux protein
MSKDLRKLEARAAGMRKVFRITLVVGMLAAVLFVWKLAQTPEWALQHDPAVQEQVGVFVFFVIAIGLSSFFFWLSQKRLQGKARRLREARIDELRARLANVTDDSSRASIESQLREIGA